jgi:hypothetical protein
MPSPDPTSNEQLPDDWLPDLDAVIYRSHGHRRSWLRRCADRVLGRLFDPVLDRLAAWRRHRVLQEDRIPAVLLFQTPHAGEVLETDPEIWLAMSGRFLDAARDQIVSQPLVVHLDFPTYYLAAHSMELALKAYLLHKDWSVDSLKAASHDLVTLSTEARTSGFRSALREPDWMTVRMLNPDLLTYARLEGVGAMRDSP